MAVPAEVQQGTGGGGNAGRRPAQQVELGEGARLLSLNVLQVETTNQEVFAPDVFRHKIHLHGTQKEKGTDRLKQMKSHKRNEGELKVNDVSHLIDIVQRRSFVRPVAFTLFFSILHQSCHHNYYSTSILPHHLSHAKSQRKYKTNFISEHITFILLKVFMHGILFNKQFQRQIYKFIHTYIIQKNE